MTKGIRSILLWLAVIIGATVIFRIFNLDIKIQSLFYDYPDGGWKFSNNPVVVFLYKYGTIPGLVLSGAAIIIFALSPFIKKIESFRNPAILIMATVLLGPGLIINVVLKNHSGRPRPRDVKEFNGKWEYRHALEFGVPGKGHSFPAGHPSMAFLFGALYFAYRDKNRKAAAAFFAAGLAYGTAMGLGRMAQGAHFASDVIWSAAITLLAAKAVQELMIKRGVFEFSGKKTRAAERIVISSALLFMLIIFFLLSTPFYAEKYHSFKAGAESYTLKIHSAEAEIILEDSEKNGSIRMKIHGFGFPGSGYNENFRVDAGENKVQAVFITEKTGFFSELTADMRVALPASKKTGLMINNAKGTVTYGLSGNVSEAVIFTAKGDIYFSPKSGSSLKTVYIKTGSGDIFIKLPKGLVLEKNAALTVHSGGKTVIINRSKYFRDLNSSAGKINRPKPAKQLVYRGVKQGSPSFIVNAAEINVAGE